MILVWSHFFKVLMKIRLQFGKISPFLSRKNIHSRKLFAKEFEIE